MTAIEIRAATLDDARTIERRPAGLAEVQAWSSDPPEVALEHSIAHSSEAWAGLADGELVCLFGVAPLTLVGVTGVPWLAASAAIARHRTAFLRRNRAMIDRWQEQYPVLRNFVDARNAVSIRWLRWLGFTLGPAVPLGIAGLPFHIFERTS